MDRRGTAIAIVMTTVAMLAAGAFAATEAQSPAPPLPPPASQPPCPSPDVTTPASSVGPGSTADPCRPGSYLVDLANAGGSVRPDPGHYEGVANVECGYVNGTWQGSLDHATPTSGPRVRLYSITQAPPPGVYVDTVNSTSDPGDWAISASEVSANVDVQGQDLGDTAILSFTASDEFQTMSGWLTCSEVVRG